MNPFKKVRPTQNDLNLQFRFDRMIIEKTRQDKKIRNIRRVNARNEQRALWRARDRD